MTTAPRPSALARKDARDHVPLCSLILIAKSLRRRDEYKQHSGCRFYEQIVLHMILAACFTGGAVGGR